MIPASLDSGHRLIADTLAAFRAGPALGSIALRPAPRSRVPLYIGIAGSKRSGKDTLANGLASALSLPCDSFAAPLRQLVASSSGSPCTNWTAARRRPSTGWPNSPRAT